MIVPLLLCCLTAALPPAGGAASQEPVVWDRPLGEWIVEVADRDVGRRRTAAQALGQFLAREFGVSAERPRPPVPDQAVERLAAALCRALRDSDSEVRVRAVEAFGWGGREPAVARRAVSAMIRALKDEDAEIRCRAARAFWEFGPEGKPAVAALAEALRDKDRRVAENAAGALFFLGKDAAAAVPALVRALDGVGGIGGPGGGAGTPGPRGVAMRALAVMGESVLPVLTELLKDRDPRVREAAAAALDYMGRAAAPAADDMLAALGDPEAGVRDWTFDALWRMAGAGDPLPRDLRGRMAAKLRELAAGSGKALRDWAEEKLGQVDPPRRERERAEEVGIWPRPRPEDHRIWPDGSEVIRPHRRQ